MIYEKEIKELKFMLEKENLNSFVSFSNITEFVSFIKKINKIIKKNKVSIYDFNKYISEKNINVNDNKNSYNIEEIKCGQVSYKRQFKVIVNFTDFTAYYFISFKNNKINELKVSIQERRFFGRNNGFNTFSGGSYTLPASFYEEAYLYIIELYINFLIENFERLSIEEEVIIMKNSCSETIISKEKRKRI